MSLGRWSVLAGLLRRFASAAPAPPASAAAAAAASPSPRWSGRTATAAPSSEQLRLSEAAKDELVHLFKTQPKEFPVPKLASKFGIASERVEAIIKLRGLDRSTAASPDIFEKRMPNAREVQRLNEYSRLKTEKEGKRGVSAASAGRETQMYELTPEDAGADQGLARAEVERHLRKFRAEPPVSYEDPFANLPFKNVAGPKRFRMRFVDVSDNATPEKRAVWVRAEDGSFRAVDETEAVRVRRQYASPPQMKRA